MIFPRRRYAGQETPTLMATASQGPDIGILERVGDSLTSLSEGFVNFLSRMLGSANENTVRKLGYVRSKDKKTYAVIPGSLLARSTSWNRQCRP